MDVLIGQLATGLSLGSILLLAALGLSLTFGQMGVINMAHGEFIMAGCYTAYVVQQVITNAGASLLISLLVGFLVGGAMGALLEVTLIRRMYHRPLEGTEQFLREKFAKKPDVAEANILAFRAGWNYGETTEAFGTTYEVAKASLPPGEYRQVSGNTAMAYGVVAAGRDAGPGRRRARP